VNYYFNELDPVSFQRLVNAILVSRFGEDLRVTPLRGRDGGRDAETAPGNPFYETVVGTARQASPTPHAPPRPGRYLFQVKHHRTIDTTLADARSAVLRDFEIELQHNVLSRTDDEMVNYFFLITNVPSSRDALIKLDDKRRHVRRIRSHLMADVWWQEHVTALLDQLPSIWLAFPQLFAGGRPPFLAELYRPNHHIQDLPRALLVSIERDYQRESRIKFRQINLERDLSKLFVNLDVTVGHLAQSPSERQLLNEGFREYGIDASIQVEDVYHAGRLIRRRYSALDVLLNETGKVPNKIILEGGPGQGKSTITQIVVQIYRERLLRRNDMDPEGRWRPPSKVRVPFRIELRTFAEWISKNPKSSVENYLASTISHNTGGATVSVDNIHTIVQSSPVLLVLDGLDEIGSDDLRDDVILKINECVSRFVESLKSDLRVILTTRPPAIVGRRDRLSDFRRLPILQMDENRISNYLSRWLSVQVQDDDDKQRITTSFERRKNEPHVQALIKNPMQLSVLLHFIRLKGEAFPDRRAELYRDYFQIVIDRDVEKSPPLLKHREVIESLHQFLGYKIHALTEAEQADGTLSRIQLLEMVEGWLNACGNQPGTGSMLFKIGEERLGLITTLRGEGEDERYGYEIQPVREYFAAAYINNQIRGNAHEVFNAMVRRTFWREVAIFLAGLRRPNEKADLIVRSRTLDNDDSLGWRQDGRSITLQLLAEGVYSEPKHVFAEGLALVLELLDPEKTPLQNEVRELATLLPGIIRQDTSGRGRASIQALVRKYNDSDERLALRRLYRIAYETLDKQTLSNLLLDSHPGSSQLLVRTRLLWPAVNDVDLSVIAQNPSYWDGASDQDWVRSWWRASIANPSATTLSAPTSFHNLLIEQFASLPVPSLGPSPMQLEERMPFPTIDSEWAFWRLMAYRQLTVALVFGPQSENLHHSISTAFRKLQAVPTTFVGLEDTYRTVLVDLLEISRVVLSELCNNTGYAMERFAEHCETIHKCLEFGGITGWLACRWAGTLLFSIGIESPRAYPNSSINVELNIYRLM
jgi:NACHT domain